MPSSAEFETICVAYATQEVCVSVVVWSSCLIYLIVSCRDVVCVGDELTHNSLMVTNSNIGKPAW